ncbi:ABC transporter substrate-binding protein [Prauserella cavernicola]|uniref:ABC transporter substrate-binding protein n=1 Tax=Prauserella cavernicola TaxID=2800127 RepID=A0A934QVR2_9PSEU|nr:ABC transporter substrate-binding protein [Prauserella cavernicola]MBK1786209.1 ABC transporter substrate-binding protein [Prauserella cavernicola]
MIKRILAPVLAVVLLLSACQAKPGERSEGGQLTIGVGGQPLLVYLPTTLAQRLGYYEDEGLNVTLEDLQGGSKALQALQGGSVDVVSGYYDHAIQMAAKDRDVQSFVSMLRYPSLVIAVSPKASKPIESIADLAGANVGVTAPGSSTDFFLKYLLGKEGLPADSATVQAVGGDSSAVAAMEQGRVDAAVMLDPAFSLLQQRVGADEVQVLTDTRTAEGVQEDFGVSTYPAAVLYSTGQWLENNDDNARKLAKAIVRTLEWIDQHSAEEIAAEMPEEYAQGNRDVYVESIAKVKEAYSKDGTLEADGAEAVREVLAQFIPEVERADIDVSTTFSNDYLPSETS